METATRQVLHSKDCRYLKVTVTTGRHYLIHPKRRTDALCPTIFFIYALCGLLYLSTSSPYLPSWYIALYIFYWQYLGWVVSDWKLLLSHNALLHWLAVSRVTLLDLTTSALLSLAAKLDSCSASNCFRRSSAALTCTWSLLILSLCYNYWPAAWSECPGSSWTVRGLTWAWASSWSWPPPAPPHTWGPHPQCGGCGGLAPHLPSPTWRWSR